MWIAHWIQWYPFINDVAIANANAHYEQALGETFFICWITLPTDLKIGICKKKKKNSLQM